MGPTLEAALRNELAGLAARRGAETPPSMEFNSMEFKPDPASPAGSGRNADCN